MYEEVHELMDTKYILDYEHMRLRLQLDDAGQKRISNGWLR